MDFRNRSVIVTGSANGIGRCVAEKFAHEQARVIIADIDRDHGEQTASNIRSRGGDAHFLHADMADPDSVNTLISGTAERCGTIDILINNAGISAFTPIDELTVEQWDHILNTNLRGYFLCARASAGIMRKNGGGSIINIASTRALMSEPDSEAYAASKGGVLALTHAMSASLAEDRIRVNCISPGWIQTGDYDKLRDIDHEQHPSRRVGKPDDIARACLFLADPENDFITGENLVIDGGMTRKMIYAH